MELDQNMLQNSASITRSACKTNKKGDLQLQRNRKMYDLARD